MINTKKMQDKYQHKVKNKQYSLQNHHKNLRDSCFKIPFSSFFFKPKDFGFGSACNPKSNYLYYYNQSEPKLCSCTHPVHKSENPSVS